MQWYLFTTFLFCCSSGQCTYFSLPLFSLQDKWKSCFSRQSITGLRACNSSGLLILIILFPQLCIHSQVLPAPFNTGRTAVVQLDQIQNPVWFLATFKSISFMLVQHHSKNSRHQSLRRVQRIVLQNPRPSFMLVQYLLKNSGNYSLRRAQRIVLQNPSPRVLLFPGSLCINGYK